MYGKLQLSLVGVRRGRPTMIPAFFRGIYASGIKDPQGLFADANISQPAASTVPEIRFQPLAKTAMTVTIARSR